MDASVRAGQLTPEQAAALSTRHVSVALSAGAGCGKTFVLTERFISHLEPTTDGRPTADLSGVVAITFTERAAREMRGRIRQAAHRRLAAARDAQAAHWLDVVRRIDTARISTIHSFCGALLRAHAVEARLDPRFAVLEEAQAGALLSAVTDDVLRELLARRDATLLDCLTIVELPRLRDCLATFVRARQRFDLESWQGIDADDLVNRWARFHRETSVPGLIEQLQAAPSFIRLQSIVATAVPPSGEMTERFADLQTQFARLKRLPDVKDALDRIHQAARLTKSRAEWADLDAKQAFQKAAEAVRKLVEKAQEKLTFDDAGAREAAELGLLVARVALPVAAAYAERKRQLGALDFDDLLIRARDLLCAADASALRERIAASIDVLLVDEFQDTDHVQVELVEALCGQALVAGKLFFVGDHKQSIYRFRGAEPEVFHKLRERIPCAGRLPLSRNFRSQPAILDFVNGLFQDEFENDEPLKAHRDQVAPVPAVEFLWATVECEPPAKPNRPQLREEEADWIARRLRVLVDSGTPLVWQKPAGPAAQATARPLRPGDIALLFRAMTNVEVYERALRRWGFDYYLVGGRAFYAQQEIYDLLNLLRALASPGDQLSLFGALRSPLFGLTDETLFWLGQHPQGLGRGLLDCLSHAPPPQLEPAQAAQVRHAAATIVELRALADRAGVAQLISLALARTGYDAALLAEFLGERKLANLNKLVAQARAFDRSGALTLTDFIRQLAEQVAREPHEAPAATQPESTDVVRLMTIHQAKGLEFPLVVVPDLERQPQGLRATAACDPQLGPLVKPPGSECATTGLDLYLAAESRADVAERARLFYVATTRAADYLILSSGVEKLADAKAGTWREFLAHRYDLVAGAYLGRPLSTGRPPSVRVTTERPEVVAQAQADGQWRALVASVEAARDLAASGGGEMPRFVQPVAADPKARRLFSFSRLSGALQVEETDDDHHDEPALALATANRTAAAGSDFGILVHAALAQWCRAPVRSPAECRRLVERAAALANAADAGAVEAAADLVVRWAASPRADAIRAAAERHPELEFLLSHPDEDGRNLAIRGFIDCLYLDAEGRYRVIDYKTHAVAGDAVAGAGAAYRLQLLTYALAVEAATGQRPAELVLSFLRPAREITIACGDADLAWARREITSRIAALHAAGA